MSNHLIPTPTWFPSSNEIEQSNLMRLMQKKGFSEYREFHRWSHTHYKEFWKMVVDTLGIQFDTPYQDIVDVSHGLESPEWFTGGKLNIVKSCFEANGQDIAIISQNEKGEQKKFSYQQLNKLSNRIANSLSSTISKGDRVAIIMPMSIEAVAIYLGILKVGGVVVSIADSFSGEEIILRLNIAETKLIFTQDIILRDGKKLPLYERIKVKNKGENKGENLSSEHHSICQTIVIEAKEKSDTSNEKEKSYINNETKKNVMNLQKNDLYFEDFLSENETFEPLSLHPSDFINILFSSGTTGDPKAIPWTETTPIKCASDAFFHMDLKPGERFCWPSNLGWMMGPWLIFACFINKATMVIYEGTPNGRSFGECIEKTQVSILGVVPTMVKTWRNSHCMEGLNWQAIKCFASTGECSNPEDMQYLMSLAGNRPVIEYCGGTEIGGAYITSTLISPSAPSSFTTPSLGLDFCILDEEGKASEFGEVAIIPPSIGLSTLLLNKDHHTIYYEDMSKLPDGRILRRHGDEIEHFSNGFYRLHGRVDDTMKLGGIKVSSAEIERVLNTMEGIFETAAIAIEPEDFGPAQLVIYVVCKNQKTKKSLLELKNEMQNEIKKHLNPLFKIHDLLEIEALPRTASNKIMRRVLRNQYQKKAKKA